MEYVYFTIVAIGAYIISDRLLDWLERRRGERFEYRQVYFFAILLVLAVGSFQIIGLLSQQ